MKNIEAAFWILVLCIVLALGAGLVAFGAAQPAGPGQSTASTVPSSTLDPSLVAATEPALTELQKLRLQNALQALEITRLRAEQAARDFETARAAAGALVTSLEVKGYTLDLQQMAYVRVPPTEPPMP